MANSRSGVEDRLTTFRATVGATVRRSGPIRLGPLSLPLPSEQTRSGVYPLPGGERKGSDQRSFDLPGKCLGFLLLLCFVLIKNLWSAGVDVSPGNAQRLPP
jgi:hypothetical protein